MTVSLHGNLHLACINIEGRDHLLVSVDRSGGPLLYESDAGTAEIRFCQPGEDLDGKDPAKCLRLHYAQGDDIIFVQN